MVDLSNEDFKNLDDSDLWCLQDFTNLEKVSTPCHYSKVDQIHDSIKLFCTKGNNECIAKIKLLNPKEIYGVD